MCTTAPRCERHTTRPTTAPTASDPVEDQRATDPSAGSFFLALDGYTGPAWDDLPVEWVEAAYTLTREHLSSAAPVDEAHARLSAVPDVAIVCHTTTGETFLCSTSPTGQVEAYAHESDSGEPHVFRAVVDGAVVEALYGRLVTLLGPPTREDSNAAG